ncbi:MAG TPA: OstA-like protein [Chitinophagales bacterium]|nr:OstA-like protein [Chitinophagales bacterium]
MNHNYLNIKQSLTIVFLIFFSCFQANAQSSGGISIPFDPLKLLPKTGTIAQDSVQKRTIEILYSDFLEQQTDTSTGIVKRVLKGNVRLLHDGAYMYCDSAILYPQSNYLEAIGKVKIIKGDSVDVRSEILKYDGNTKIALLERNVRLKDRGSILTAPMMTFEVDNEIGHFYSNGKLVSDSTVLTSCSGTNYQKSGYAVFKGDVVLVHPDYNMYADSMKYFTESKMVHFIAKTIIISDGDTIITDDGYFDTQNSKAYLKGRSIIKNGSANTLQSDIIDYDKSTGIGIATGNVVSINTDENATLLSNHLHYVDSIKYTRATEDPLMIQTDGTDTLYLSADTLINYSIPRTEYEKSLLEDVKNDADSSLIDSLIINSLDSSVVIDSLGVDSIDSLEGVSSKNDSILSLEFILPKDTLFENHTQLDTSEIIWVVDSLIQHDTLLGINDSSIVAENDSVKVFYGYRNVKLIRGNLSGVCDSIYFNSKDSVFKLYYEPILWMDSTQMKADSIYIFMKDKKAERVELYQNAIIITQNEEGIYNQIGGKRITGWLKNDKINHVLVNGDAECIYYLKNDSNQYIGGNLASSALINISFNDSSEIQRIKLEISPEAKFTPIQKIDFGSYQLDNFSWFWSYKPQSKWDIIRDSFQYQMYLLEHPLAIDSNQIISDSISSAPEMSSENVMDEIIQDSSPMKQFPALIEEGDKTILPQQKRANKKGKKEL